MVHSMKLAKSSSPESVGAEEVGDAEPGLLALAREGEAHPLRRPRLVLPDDEVVALGVGGEVAVGHLGDEEVGLLGLGQLFAQHGLDPGP